MLTKELVLKEEFEVFYNFCSFIETYEVNEVKGFLQQLRKQLLSIYTFGLSLPSTFIPDENDYSEHFSRLDVREKVKVIADKLINSRYYWEVFNPIDFNDIESVCGDIIEDIEDIYTDLRNTLSLLNVNTDKAFSTANWQFEFQFRTHWGDHCINALRAYHFFYKNKFSPLLVFPALVHILKYHNPLR